MIREKLLFALGVCLVVMASSTAMAQITNYPWTEDFEGLNNGSGSCAASCPNIGDFTQNGTRN